MSAKRRLTILRILVLVSVIALIVVLFLFRNQVKKLENYGYVGIFLISIAANATIIIPLPGVAFTTAMGAIFNPIGVAVAAGLGAAVGELSGYLAGFSGQGVMERAALYERLTTRILLIWRSWYWPLSPTRSSTWPGWPRVH
jgi:membrane protein YqaA with SNARE-associated domain